MRLLARCREALLLDIVPKDVLRFKPNVQKILHGKHALDARLLRVIDAKVSVERSAAF